MPVATFIVEDNVILLRGLVEALEEMGGARVVGNANAAGAAVAWLTARPADWNLVIVDLFLVEGSGLDVLEACRQRHPHQRAVVLTNYATPEIRRRSLAFGADRVFDKSTEIDELMAYCAELSAA